MEQVQIHLRLPPELHEHIRDRAKQRGVSLNSMIVEVIGKAVPSAICPMCDGTGKLSAVLVEWIEQERSRAAATARSMTTSGEDPHAAASD
jgi:hypothetical protein